ncbi:MAG: translation initiation factor IF-2, partial [Romboutsia sp.]
VDIRSYTIIYKAIEDVQAAMTGMLDPEYRDEDTGKAEVRELFKLSGVGTIAGCYVTTGKIFRGSKVRIVRDGIIIHEGQLAALRRFKDDVKEVNTGYECGMTFTNYSDLKEGDIVEGYITKEIERKLK